MTAHPAFGYISIDTQAPWPNRPDPWISLRTALVIGEDLSDHVARVGGERGVRVPVVGQLDERLGQGTSTTSRLGGAIHLQRSAKVAPHTAGEKAPRDTQVTGRVTHACA